MNSSRIICWTKRIGLLTLTFSFLGHGLAPWVRAAEEIWLTPKVKDADTTVGDWAVTSHGDTHFSFAVPDDFESFVEARVVMTGKHSKEILCHLLLSVSRNLLPHDDFVDSLAGLPATVVEDELLEVDVSAIFPALIAGQDYVSLHFDADRVGAIRVIGMRFVYESTDDDDDATKRTADPEPDRQ